MALPIFHPLKPVILPVFVSVNVGSDESTQLPLLTLYPVAQVLGLHRLVMLLLLEFQLVVFQVATFDLLHVVQPVAVEVPAALVVPLVPVAPVA